MKSKPRLGFAAMAASCGVPAKAERAHPFCPQPGSLASLIKRFTATRKRFTDCRKRQEDPAALLAGAEARLRSSSL